MCECILVAVNVNIQEYHNRIIITHTVTLEVLCLKILLKCGHLKQTISLQSPCDIDDHFISLNQRKCTSECRLLKIRAGYCMEPCY